MKSLEISEEQKEKLLEMCKVLFPEYERYCFWGTENQPYVRMYNVDEYEEELSENNCSIHWFEFCNTWLVDKLWKKLDAKFPDSHPLEDHVDFNLMPAIHGDEMDLKILMIISGMNTNPIAYLYEQFKKL